MRAPSGGRRSGELCLADGPHGRSLGHRGLRRSACPEVLHEDHLALLKNAVIWAAEERQPLTVDGPGVIDIAYWRQQGSLTAHLVNLSNAMSMKGPVRAAIPLQGPITVSMTLPSGAQVKAVSLLESEKPAQFQRRALIDNEILPT